LLELSSTLFIMFPEERLEGVGYKFGTLPAPAWRSGVRWANQKEPGRLRKTLEASAPISGVLA